MRAVLLATTPGSLAAVDDETVAGRLIRQLSAFGSREITVITRPEYRAGLPAGVTVVTSGGVREDLRLLTELADTGRGLLLACADTVLPDTAVSAVLADPTSRSGALVGPVMGARPLDVPVHRDHGMVLSVSTGFHTVSKVNAVASGLLRISEPHAPELARVLRQVGHDKIADLAPGADSWTLTLLGLVRDGVRVNTYEVPGLHYGRVAGQAGARQLLSDIHDSDEDAVRLDLCVKRDDDLFATYCISSYSRHLVRWCARLGLTPVGVTWISILLALGAAGLFFQGSRLALVGGAAAMYVSFTLDCVDGQLARYKHQFSNFGGWLDMIADRGKEYLLYGGLAAGAAAQGLTWAWPLAIAAITLQTARHMTDTWYGTLQDAATHRTAVRDLTVASDRDAAPHGATSQGGAGALAAKVGRKLGKLSDQFIANRRSPSYWFKRTVVFPVGERWLVMALGAAIFDGRIALGALLAGQLIALGYTLAGRGLRAWAAKMPVLDRADVSTHRDDGVLLSIPMGLRPPVLPVLLVGMAGVAAAVVLSAVAPEAAVYGCLGAGVLLLASITTAGSRHSGTFDWLVPAGLRAAEFGLIVACGLTAEVPTALIFALLGVLALYQYDLAARIDKAASPMLSRAYGLGWDGRVLVVLLALIPGVGPWVFAALTAYLTVVFFGGALSGRRRPAAATAG